MDNKARMNLARIGLKTDEIEAIERLIDLIKSVQNQGEEGRNLEVNSKIRQTYSLSEELSILRKQLESVSASKTEEFEEFEKAVEEAKKSDIAK